MILSKKALSNYLIIILITGIVFLIVASMFIKNSFDSTYYGDINLCKNFFDSINGNSIFFDKEKQMPKIKFINSVEDICPSKKIEVSNEKDVKRISNLIKDCSAEFNYGIDIFKGKYEGTSICVYCGDIKINKEVKDISNLLKNELDKEKYEKVFISEDSINLNSLTIGNEKYLENIFSDTDEIFIFYKIESKYIEPSKEGVLKTIGKAVIENYNLETLDFEDPRIKRIYEKINEIENPPISYLFLGKKLTNAKTNKEAILQYTKKGGCNILIVPKKEYS